jgi:hypothetical protein
MTSQAVYVILRHVRVTVVAVEKQLSITYSECACSLVIQDVERMRRIILSVDGLTVQYFSSLSHKCHDFLKILLNIKRVLFFSTTFS